MSQRAAAMVLVKRMLTESEIAEYLGRDLGWLRLNLATLTARGFPAPLPGIDRYDRLAVDAWLDVQAGPGELVFNG